MRSRSHPGASTRWCSAELAITADTDLRLARYFGMSEGFFLGLQTDYELLGAQTPDRRPAQGHPAAGHKGSEDESSKSRGMPVRLGRQFDSRPNRASRSSSPAFKTQGYAPVDLEQPIQGIGAHEHHGYFFPGLKFVFYKRDAETAQVPTVSEVERVSNKESDWVSERARPAA